MTHQKIPPKKWGSYAGWILALLLLFFFQFAGKINAQSLPCLENFDGVTTPALPASWPSASGVASAASLRWEAVSNTSDSPPNSAFVPRLIIYFNQN